MKMYVWGILALLVSVLVILPGCTVVQYTETPAVTEAEPDPAPTRKLTIADVRVSGSAIDLEATLTNIGNLKVNRAQGSAGEAAATVINAATSSPADVVGL